MGRFDRCTRQPPLTSSRFPTTMLLLTDGSILCGAAYTPRRRWIVSPDTRDWPSTPDDRTYVHAFFTDVAFTPSGYEHSAGVVAATGEAIGMTHRGLEIRVISLRRANKREERAYAKERQSA